MRGALSKKYFSQFFVGPFITAIFIYCISQINIDKLFDNNRILLTAIAVMVFSVMFFVDFKKILKEVMRSRGLVLLVSVTMAIVAAIIFVGVIMLPVYLTQISNSALLSILCAMIGSALGYGQVLFIGNKSMVGDGYFARIRFAIGGAIIGGAIGLGIHLSLTFFS